MPLLTRAHRLISAVLLSLVCAAGTLSAADTSRPFSRLIQDWDRSLDLVEQELAQRSLLPARVTAIRQRLLTLGGEIQKTEKQAHQQLKPLREQADALGPPPSDEEAVETEEVTQRREALAEAIAIQEGRIKQTQLLLSRVTQLKRDVQSRALSHLLENLLSQGPIPIAPETVLIAAPELLQHLGAMLRSPADWWTNLSDERRHLFLFQRLPLILLIAVVGGLVLRWALLRWLGRDSRIERPPYARRLAAAIGEGLANGIVPALILGGLLFRATAADTLISGLFKDVMLGFCWAAVLIVLARALPRAVLAPDHPSWRLVPVGSENAIVMSRVGIYLAAAVALSLFLSVALQSRNISPELLSFYRFFSNILEAVGVLILMRGRLWVTAPQDETPDEGKEAHPTSEQTGQAVRPFMAILRQVISAVAIAVIPISLLGYTSLGNYLMARLIISGGVIGIIFLVRGLGREVIGLAIRSNVMRVRLAVGYRTRNRLKFWIRLIYDVVLLATCVIIVLLVWGVPRVEMLEAIHRTLDDIKIGNVTFSLTDIAAAITVFAVILILTRMFQRVLGDRLLPRTRFDVGVRNSLSTGFGYLGVILAVALGIAALGLDLSNLALIAGALSVGIGFGLQNVVNNFVSGLILLVERPIKVGDWIITGEHEGFVKRIYLRATEIETFKRASIIIPNSELLSGALTNWTHKDHYGRVDVPIVVAYGSDTAEVMEILERCLNENQTILDWPAPKVLLRTFDERGLGFEARGFIPDIGLVFDVESELRLDIYARFAESGVKIPFPQRDIHIKDLGRLKDLDRLTESVADSPQSGEAGHDGSREPKTA